MKKICLVLGLFSILFIMNFAYASNWTQITSFTGSGTEDKTTEYFNCTHAEWRLNWNFTPDPVYPNYTAFSFYVYQKGDNISMDSVYEAYPSNTNGTESIHDALGTFYLKINVANTGNYSISVEQDLDSAIPEFPVGLAAIIFFTITTIAVLAETRIRKLHHYNHPIFVNSQILTIKFHRVHKARNAFRRTL